MRTPCCNTLFCQDCIQTYLDENDFFCPNCHDKIPTLASLRPDAEARRKVNDYVDAAFEEERRNEIKSANVVPKVRTFALFETIKLTPDYRKTMMTRNKMLQIRLTV